MGEKSCANMIMTEGAEERKNEHDVREALRCLILSKLLFLFSGWFNVRCITAACHLFGLCL